MSLESQAIAHLESLKKDSNYRSLKRFNFSVSEIFDNSKDSKSSQTPTLFNLASNDYLALARDKDFNQAFLDSKLFKEHCHFSASSSRLLSGNFEIYSHLESHLKSLFCKEALLFNSGYHANIGAISALSALNILFVTDKSIHASHIDGLKNFKPTHFKRFLHNDMESLEKILSANAPLYDAVVVLSEALFSMEGDFTNLKQLVALKEKFSNMYLYIDEAHSIGSVGANGLGLCAKLGLLERIDFIVLTFGKALASVGACILCNATFKDYFINTARALIYSTAIPPINVARTLFGFLHLQDFNMQRKHLNAIATEFRESLKTHLPLEILGDYNIVSLVLGDNARAVQFSTKLLECGYFAPAIKSPTVPRNKALLRFSLCADMESQHLENLVKTLQKIANAN